MSVLKPNVNELGSYFLVCPECKAPREFKLFYTNMSLSLKGISVFPFHRRYSCICPNCKNLYYINEEKGDKYLLDRTLSLTTDDLRKTREKGD